MDALEKRDGLFSDLHARYLKPLGYKKEGAWSRLSEPPFHWGTYLRSSRWNSRDAADFWLDICVLHEDYEQLFYQRRASRLSERTPGMVYIELGQLLKPVVPRWTIEEFTNLDVLKTRIFEAFQSKALPTLHQCKSLEGVLEFYRSHPQGWSRVAHMGAAVYLLLQRREEAIAAMSEAKANAANDRVLAWLNNLESQMLANNALVTDACASALRAFYSAAQRGR